jgi:hypothetical protein
MDFIKRDKDLSIQFMKVLDEKNIKDVAVILKVKIKTIPKNGNNLHGFKNLPGHQKVVDSFKPIRRKEPKEYLIPSGYRKEKLLRIT